MTGIPEPITITIHGKQAAYIHRLAETGLYGETPEVAARQLVMQALQHIMRDKLISPDTSADEEEPTVLRTEASANLRGL